MLMRLLLNAVPAGAQEPGAVILLFQPGLRVTDVLSAPQATGSSTAFNLRFEARLGTGLSWLRPLVGASVTPYGSSRAGARNNNAPFLFVGGVVPVVSSDRTGGWLSIELPMLLQYSLGGGGERNQRLYGRDFVVQVAGYAHLGRKLLGQLGESWRRADVYVHVEQNLTPNRSAGGRRDFFNPAVAMGVSIPFGAVGGEER